MDSSLSEKKAFFKSLKSLSFDEDDDDLGSHEDRARQRSRRLFEPPPAPAGSDGPTHGRKPEEERAQAMAPVGRVVSAPIAPRVSSAQIIKGTPNGAFPRKGRLAAALHADSTIVGETPLPVTAALQRSDSTPLPSMKRLLGRDSPSITVKRRKRDAVPPLRSEEEQIFKGLAFFYVPDNDIAPARRLRINKAKEYGAVWTRDVASATHVVVEKSIAYKDIKSVLAKTAGESKVVNEDYPIDCIQFRAVLNHNQKKYQLTGQPNTGCEVAAAPHASDESIKSLQLKPAQRNPKRWDYVVPGDTPPRSEEPSQRSCISGTAATVDSQPITLNLDQAGTSSQRAPSQDHENSAQGADNTEGTGSGLAGHGAIDSHKDELSDYISMMQEYKNLPLEPDEDDTRSALELPSDEDHSGSEPEQPQGKKYGKRGSRPRKKELAYEDRFVCNQAAEKDAAAGNPNARTIEVLQSMADYYNRINDHWRTTGYRKAIATLKRQEVKITTEEEAFRLPSIGQRLAQKIEEIVTTDRLQRLEYATKEPMDEALQLFLGIYGVGNAQAQQWIAQGFRTLDDLTKKAKLTTNQRVGVEHYHDLNQRIPRHEVAALGAVVKTAAARIDPDVELIIGGSYRRGAESSHDIDFIVTKRDTETSGDLRPFLDELVQRLQNDDFLVARLASSKTTGDGSKWHGCCKLPAPPRSGTSVDATSEEGNAPWRRIDFLLVPEPEMGAALIYFTGNDIFNRSMRLLARKKGMGLNQRGLYKDVIRAPGGVKVTDGELVEGKSERRIFEILNVEWREPHERWC